MVGKASSRTPDDRKFRELVLFICQRSEGDAPFGATKLNKLLFYADFLAFKTLGRAITDHRYQRLANGPAPRALVPILEEMIRNAEVAQAKRNYFGRHQIRTVALREPDLSVFSAAEIALVTQLIAEFWGQSATDISHTSHSFLGWKLAHDGEDIPYELALVEFEELTESDLQHGRTRASQLAALAQECLARDPH